ncbi:MAG: hypothetical protein M3Z04_16315, partial [Chloroflexota bacterium]|nr:hypothetical protein [Chloroflexota bacterium]
MYTRFSTLLPLLAGTFLLTGCGSPDSAATFTPSSPVTAVKVAATPPQLTAPGAVATPPQVVVPKVAATPPPPVSPTAVRVPTTVPLATAGKGGQDTAAGAIPAAAAT